MQIEEIYQIYKNHPVISTDNRKIDPGCIFVGIKGDKFDGNSFAGQALEAGAAYAIIDNKDYLIDGRTILVKNTIQTLQQLANKYRRSLSVPVIAVCGSNGKTTTKELMYAVLSSHYRTFATRGNLNNHIGVPLTILSIPFNTEMVIIEIGANHLNETYDLCKVAEPDYGLVTNNGKDHLEGFGSVENVIKANSELYQWLGEKMGIAFVNTNYPDLDLASAKLKRITYGFELVNNYPFSVLPHHGFAAINFGEEQLELVSNLFGDFNCDNIATAATVGAYFKVPADKMKRAIANYQPGLNRSQILHAHGVIYYLDCYNANPSSMTLALKSFAGTSGKPKAVVLADMLELGEFSEEEHRKMLDVIKLGGFDKIVLVGEIFGKVKGDLDCIHFYSTDEAKKWFITQDFKGWHVFLKGSRGYALEKLINF